MYTKYRAEAGLNVFTSWSTLIPIEKLYELTGKDDRSYHIYSVLATDEYYIDLGKTKQKEDQIIFDLYRVTRKGFEHITLSPFCLNKDLNHTKIDIISDYPFDKVSLQIKDEEFLKSHPDFPARIITLLPINLIDATLTDLGKRQKFEVLYIGQAFGNDGSRTALHRLSSHSTLQKILTEKNIKYPNKHIYLFLLEIRESLNLLFDGITPQAYKSDAETKQHIKNVISDLPRENQVINITEAALIHHFKPAYNVKLVDSFPNPLLKGYRQYFDLDYNSLMIELDLSFTNGMNIELYSDANRTNNAHEFIQYPLFNDNNRISMYDIFKNMKN